MKKTPRPTARARRSRQRPALPRQVEGLILLANMQLGLALDLRRQLESRPRSAKPRRPPRRPKGHR